MATMIKRNLELLAPAANAEVAMQAVLHGADAVYIGASSHGARKGASNSLEDIAKLVRFAHKYRAKVYVTVNTIVFDDELKEVERLCGSLYKIGADALIVQDMALLRMDLPPIQLHASTQCDIRTPEKARFLQDVGFSQLVLARELTLEEISAIVNAVDIPVESFIHGALCVSYSGRCHASQAVMSRSANRGECAQLCRLPYTLRDSDGKVMARDKHLLSLHDLNASVELPALIDAGVTSFKIEGRLKDAMYVKNIVAHYNGLINDIIEERQGAYARSSYGQSDVAFVPNPEKSFNRGFTTYFMSSRRPKGLASLLTPKSLGECISDVNQLKNGDGISFFDKNGNYQGANVNRVESGRIITGKKLHIPNGTSLHRTFDIEWNKMMSKTTAERRLRLNITMDDSGVTAEDERGMMIRLPLEVKREKGIKVADYESEFSKLGNTPYRLEKYEALHDPYLFIPRSEITALRRRIVEALDMANEASYPFQKRRKENSEAIYAMSSLDYRDNVSNRLAEQFYLEHGVDKLGLSLESRHANPERGTVVMTARHCILRELGLCKKERLQKFREPLRLSAQDFSFRLRFNCRDCEMEVLLD